MDDFDVETMNILLEQSAPVRSSVGKQMGHLMKEGILTTKHFLEGFKEIAEVADDLATDVPKVWLYLAEILVPMLSTEALSFSDLKTATTGRHQLDVEILCLLLEEKGSGWIWQRLDEAGMSLKDFASGDSVGRLAKENKLEFTVGPAGDAAALSAEAIHAKLLQMMQGAPATTDEVAEWISQPVTKCGSQDGKAKNGEKTDVKLHEAENPWKPAWLRGSQAEQDKTADLYKKVRGILNKLTPQKFFTLVQQVQALPIDNSERLHGVIDLVFEKAVNEPLYSEAYAQMCKVLSNMQVAGRSKKGQPENFRKLLLSRCQNEFEKNTQADLKRDDRLKEIEQCIDPEKEKELQLEFEETQRRLRMKSVGNIRFVGELFKLGMLTSTIMHRCIQQFLKQRDEESLECLCKLLTTIGKDLESKKHDLSKYFEEMKVLSKQQGQIPFCVRFMLLDVIELRENKWIPRRDDSAPKTIYQINREAEREAMMQMEMLYGGGGGSRGCGGRRDNWGEYRRRRGGPSEDGWQSLQRKNHDTSTLRIKPSDLMNVSLGRSNQFSAWSQGAGRDSDLDRSSAFPQTSDTFAALQDVEDKKDGVAMFRAGSPPVEKQQPPPPASPAPSTQPRPASPAPEMPPPVKEKGEEESEFEKAKEQKLVAAGNEANAKVSAAALKEKKEADIIENILPKEMYGEDQWSPFNPNGKKKYERDFLIKLKDTTEAKKKPEIHSDILNWLSKDQVNRMPYGAGRGSRGGGGGRGDRGGDTRKCGGTSEDGWQSLQRKNHDTSKLRIKPSDLMNVSLGASNQFAAWTQGSDRDSDLDYRSASARTSNTFAALQDVKDKKDGAGMFSRPYGRQPAPSNAEHEKAVQSLRDYASAEQEKRQARAAGSGTPSRSSSREGSSAGQTPAPSSSQSRDDLAAAAQFILEEFINNNNYQESALSVSETFPPSNMGNFVVETMNILLERSAPVRSSVGKLLGHLMKEGILTTEQFLEGFKVIAVVADDLATDVPKVWLYLAEILVPILSMEALSFSDLKTAATGLHNLVVEILRLLVKEKGPGWIRQRWDVAGMSWKDFAPADSIDRIVKENKLELTVGDAAALSAEAIHAKLLQMLQGAPATTDEVIKWISANVGDRVKTPEFIRVLTTAVCESAYQASSLKKFEEALFSRYSTLLQKYIDTREELELHCLYAVQELNHRLEQPSGLLCSLFQSLWDYGCVASETFLKWEQSKDPAFLQGKGIALKSLTASFTALREAGDDSSEECASKSVPMERTTNLI